MIVLQSTDFVHKVNTGKLEIYQKWNKAFDKHLEHLKTEHKPIQH